ncbi:MAG: PAS domain-containing sensor histidine kinase [Thermodesulfobacteriota bacterium]
MRRGKGKYSQAVLSFMVVLFAFMALVDFLIIRHQRAFLLADAREHARRDLQLMGTFVVDPLLAYDFLWVDQFMTRWGKEHGEVIELVAVLPNGAAMVNFRRPAGQDAVFQVSHRVDFMGEPVVTLKSVISDRQVEEMVRKLRFQLIVASFVCMLFVGVAVWFTLKRLALAPLEREIERRQKVEQELQRARDRLEERVRDRTVELESANAQLKKEIVERRAAEMSLTSLHRQNEMILESVGEGLYGIDIAGHVTFINRAALAMLGYGEEEEEELIGVHLHDFNHHLRGDGIPYTVADCPICRSFADPSEQRVSENYFGRRDGSVFPVEYVSAPLRADDGAVIGTVVVFEDITERKRAERELLALTDTLEQRVKERTARLDAANADLRETLGQLETMQGQLVETEKMAALGGLVAGVAHEINTPVGIGVTAASHLDKATQEFLALYEQQTVRRSDLERYVQTCRDSSRLLLSNLNRAAELIRSFKQVAIDQSGEVRRRFRMKGYVEEVLLSLRPLLKKSGHRVTVECDEELELTSYPGAFSQIITNFITNSVLHAFAEGEAGQLDFRIALAQGRLTFRYSDNGKGIPQEHLAHIFEPFYTSNREKGGSGLGLHIVYNIVTQKLGGTIVCTSVPGKGTAFVLEMPVAKEGEGGNEQ